MFNLIKVLLSIVLCLVIIKPFAQNKNLVYQKASDFFEKKDYKNALQTINTALKSDSVNTDYMLLKANILDDMGNYQQAYNLLTEIIEINPKEAFAYNNRGILLNRLQQTNEAIEDFNKALKLNISDTMRLGILVNRGAAKINIRAFQSAYDDFKNALKIDSLNIGVLNNIATVCDEIGKGDETLSYLYRIIKIDSTFIGAYGNIGFKYQEMGDYKTAIKFFNKTIELDKDQPLGYSNRAFNRYKLGDLNGALSDINLSIKLYPANSYAFRTRALINLALKRNANACNDISEALRLGFTKMYGDEVEKLKTDNCSAKQIKTL